MSKIVLVTYATRFGSTQDVAEAISKTLDQKGFQVDCRPMADVDSLQQYEAILIGSSVNYANWLPNAIEFVKANQAMLNQRPVALFTVHIQNIGEDAESRKNRLAYLDEVRPYLNPVAEGYFAGRFNRHAAAELMPRWFARFIPTFDLRKWEKINTWAEHLPALFKQQVQTKGENHVTINA